jgi:hypothetical protein
MAKGKMTKGKMGKGEMAKIGGEMAKGELGKGEMGINPSNDKKMLSINEIKDTYAIQSNEETGNQLNRFDSWHRNTHLVN